MRFNVRIANRETGDESAIELEADSPQDAAAQANATGCLVSGVYAIANSGGHGGAGRIALGGIPHNGRRKRVAQTVATVSIVAVVAGICFISTRRSPIHPLLGSRESEGHGRPITEPDVMGHVRPTGRAPIEMAEGDVPADFRSRTLYVTRPGNFLRADSREKLEQALHYESEGNRTALAQMRGSSDISTLIGGWSVRIFRAEGDYVLVGKPTLRFWTVRGALIEEESLPERKVAIRRQDFGNDWPLTVSEGVLTARQRPPMVDGGLRGTVELLVTAGGKTYALNAAAMSTDKYPFIDEIVGRDKDTYPLIKWGEEQIEGSQIKNLSPSPVSESNQRYEPGSMEEARQRAIREIEASGDYSNYAARVAAAVRASPEGQKLIREKNEREQQK